MKLLSNLKNPYIVQYEDSWIDKVYELDISVHLLGISYNDFHKFSQIFISCHRTITPACLLLTVREGTCELFLGFCIYEL